MKTDPKYQLWLHYNKHVRPINNIIWRHYPILHSSREEAEEIVSYLEDLLGSYRLHYKIVKKVRKR